MLSRISGFYSNNVYFGKNENTNSSSKEKPPIKQTEPNGDFFINKHFEDDNDIEGRAPNTNGY